MLLRSRIFCRVAPVWCRVSCALNLQRSSEISGLPCFYWPKQGVVVCVFLKPRTLQNLLITQPRAIYSAQTMADNLGLTLTPDSMVSFRDATWPSYSCPSSHLQATYHINASCGSSSEQSTKFRQPPRPSKNRLASYSTTPGNATLSSSLAQPPGSSPPS
jgi:hypothetical protein